MMKIEKPDWSELLRSNIGTTYDAVLDKWFYREVQPVNKMITEGVEVIGRNDAQLWHTEKNPELVKNEWYDKKGILINIKSIKKDTYESVLKDYLEIRQGYTKNAEELVVYKRAKAVLGD